MKSGAALVASAAVADRKAFLRSLRDEQVRALPYLFEFWALGHQLPPEGDWRTWVILGGRGAGKTRAGSEWVRSMVEGSRPRDPGQAKRVGLIGETMEQAREVMVFGESGILACSPPDRRPQWIAGRQMLLWPNGAEARLYSAFDPERLRGPQFDAVWADELAKWPKAKDTWDMMQFALRLGKNPRACVTTTPRNVGILKALLERDSTVQTHAPTEANRAYLADSFLAEVQERYAGTRLGRQELDGVLLADVEGALWQSARLEAAQVTSVPPLDRIVVAVDPPAGASATSDACGIVVAGIVSQGPVCDWKIYVLEDASVQGASPNEWAAAAIAAMDRHGADRMVAEVNQGGAMVETIVRSIDPIAPYVAASGVPWPGSVALYSATQDTGYDLNRLIPSASIIGLTETVLPKARAGVYDRGPALRVRLIRGDLQSVSGDQLLGGANLAVIGDGSADIWEVFQFAQAEIVDENTFELRLRLRGQAGSDGIAPDVWPIGSVFVLLDGVPEQISLASSARGVTQHYRYGSGTRPLSDPSYKHRVDAFAGNGLRPYRVAHLRAGARGGDLDITWIRRARIGGDSWDGADVPLSEAFEHYAVRVFRNGAQVRQATVTQPSWTYTAGMHMADGTGDIRIDVAQISEVFGEGPAAAVTITAP